ncbi:MAG: rhodanese-like domain-containing protein [Bacteroidetes bacterium]|nr:rhodanese-like domain-containing protein [Bacteroidota bacterium]MCB9227784.1 rhodanese-like domain-containing protein [Chitinophagales bacterium]
MKKLGFIALLFLVFVSCKTQNNKVENKEVKTEVVTEEVISKVVSQDEFKQLMSSLPNYQLIDVRTPEEIAEGKIDGALEMNFYDSNFKEQLAQLDKEKPVLVYCRSGNRSGKAAKLMNEMGFKQVYDLIGGYSEWK